MERVAPRTRRGRVADGGGGRGGRSSTTTRPHSLLVILVLVGIVQLTLSARSGGSSTSSPVADILLKRDAASLSAEGMSRRAVFELGDTLDAVDSMSSNQSSSSSSYTEISIQKNKKVKACQPLPTHKSPAKVCAHVKKHCALDGHIDYLSAYFCAGIGVDDTKTRPRPPPPTHLGLRRAGVLVAIFAWLLFLFSSVGITASDFFSPNLSTLASRLRLSESTAGVSLLAFGNGSPDVFSTFAAMKSGSGSLAIGELIGAASFITAVVAGAMMLIQPFRVKPYPFLRDVGFFTVAIALALFVLLDGTLHLVESLTLVALYIAYATLVIVGGWWQERRHQRKMAQRAGLAGAKETRPSVIEAGLAHELADGDEEDQDDGSVNERTPLRSSSPHRTVQTTPQQAALISPGTTTPTSSGPASKVPNLKLQIPQTPLQQQHQVASRYLAPPQAGPSHGRAGSISSTASSPLTSPAFGSSLVASTSGRSPSAPRHRSEYDPDADDERDDQVSGSEALTTASTGVDGYGAEADPFDRAVAGLNHSQPGAAAAASAPRRGSSAGEQAPVLVAPIPAPLKTNATVPVGAAYAFPALPPPGTAGSASTLPAGAGAGVESTPIHLNQLAPPVPLNSAMAPGAHAGAPTSVRPGYYLPRHSLLGALEFRDVVRSLRAEGAAALFGAAGRSSTSVGPTTPAARTPGDYHADNDDGSDDDLDTDGGSEGAPSSRRVDRAEDGTMRRSKSQSYHRRPGSLSFFGSLGLTARASSGALAQDPDAEDGVQESASRVGSVSRKGKGRKLRSSMGVAAGGGAGSTDEETSRLRNWRMGNAVTQTEGHDKATPPRRVSGHEPKRRVRGGSLNVNTHAPQHRDGSEDAARGPQTAVAPAPNGAGPAARDRGWELFYSRGLELESDWERLASPGAGAGAAGAAGGLDHHYRGHSHSHTHAHHAHSHPPAHESRTRTESASTTVTADADEEAHGVRMRSTSHGSHALGTESAGLLNGPSSSSTTRPRALHRRKRLRHVLTHVRDRTLEPLSHALFPSLRNLRSKSWVGIAVSVLSVPAILVLKLTLPVVVDEDEEEAARLEMDEEGEGVGVGGGAGPEGKGLLHRAGSGGSRSSWLRRGPPRLEGEERPLLAQPMIDSPAPLSSDPATPRPSDANADVAQGLKSLQGDPAAPLTRSPATSTSLQTPERANGPTVAAPFRDGPAAAAAEDGSESCDSCDEAEEDAALRALHERQERRHRASAARFLAVVQLSLGPTFCAWAILSPSSWDPRTDAEMGVVVRVFGAGTALALLCALGLALGARRVVVRRPGLRRTLGLVRCLGGFVVSVLFIMTIVDEVVAILQAMGIILGLSDAILGLTIFAMGNSLGDLVANVTIARMGHPVMAISACFAGPLLNILLGIGLSGTYILTSASKNNAGAAPPPSPTKPSLLLDFSPTLLVSCIGLLVILVGILIAVPLNGFMLDRKLGSALVVTYAFIMCVNVLTEIFVDK